MKQKYILRLIGTLLLLIFIVLGCFIKIKPEYLLKFDNYFTKIIRNNLYPGFNLFFELITQLGSFIFVILITVFCSIMFFINKKRLEAIWLSTGIIIISGILVPILKIIIDRPRPTLPHLVNVNDMSFPSGHSTVAFVLYGTLILLLNIHIMKKIIAHIYQGLLVMIIFGVGISRIYCGVHFPTDVIGGFLIGGIWLSFTYQIYEKYKRSNTV
jgi:undecaprenyl-diphosphatase